MKLFLSVLALIGVLAMTHSTRAEIKTERIAYVVSGVTYEGVLVFDSAVKGRRPGVLVCHEWWGCNDYAQKRATMLAEQGYVAFALDMFGKGKTTREAKQASEWAGEVFKDNATLRARAAAGLKILAERPETDPSRLAAIGYCMGGTVALELARSGLAHTANLKAVVAFHASTIAAANPADNANIKGSVLICHGQEDFFVKPEQISGFHEQMKAAKIDYQFISYGHAVHAFTNPAADKAGIDGVKYDAAADRRSWAAMTDLFNEKLAAGK